MGEDDLREMKVKSGRRKCTLSPQKPKYGFNNVRLWNVRIQCFSRQAAYSLFSQNRPTGPIRSSSRNVCLFVCCLSLPMQLFCVDWGGASLARGLVWGGGGGGEGSKRGLSGTKALKLWNILDVFIFLNFFAKFFFYAGQMIF